jgi:hypothetical protein
VAVAVLLEQAQHEVGVVRAGSSWWMVSILRFSPVIDQVRIELAGPRHATFEQTRPAREARVTPPMNSERHCASMLAPKLPRWLAM